MPRRNQSGFSLVEVLTVMGVLGVVITALATSLTRTLPAWRTRQAAVEIASTLRTARARAMLNRAETRIPFDISRKRYTVLAGSGVEKLTIVNGVRVAKLPANVSFIDPTGTKAVTLRVPGTSEMSGSFNSKGMLRSDNVPGYVYVGNRAYSIYWRVGVNSIGMVKAERWNGTSWQ